MLENCRMTAILTKQPSHQFKVTSFARISGLPDVYQALYCMAFGLDNLSEMAQDVLISVNPL